MSKVYVSSGKRKQAIARASVKEGKGRIRINGHLLETYTPELAKARIMEPLILAEDFAKGFDITVKVSGGGWQSQAEACRLAIAKGLVAASRGKQLKQTFLDYDRTLLVADVRRNEPHKPNDSKPRKKRQFSKR